MPTPSTANRPARSALAAFLRSPFPRGWLRPNPADGGGDPLDMLRAAWAAGASVPVVVRAVAEVVSTTLGGLARVGIAPDRRLHSALSVAASWAVGQASQAELRAAYTEVYRMHMDLVAATRKQPEEAEGVVLFALSHITAAAFAVLATAYDPSALVSLAACRDEVSPLLARRASPALVGGYHRDAVLGEDVDVAGAAASAIVNARDVRVALGEDEASAARKITAILRRAFGAT